MQGNVVFTSSTCQYKSTHKNWNVHFLYSFYTAMGVLDFCFSSQTPRVGVPGSQPGEETSEIELSSDVQKTIYPNARVAAAAAATDSYRTCHIL